MRVKGGRQNEEKGVVGEYPIIKSDVVWFKLLSPAGFNSGSHMRGATPLKSRLTGHSSDNLNVNFSRMKVLIQNPQTLLYLQAADRWSPDVAEAFDFRNSDSAIQFCTAHGIEPVQVVLQWAGMPHSITIPIMDLQPTEAGKAGRVRKHA
jgi:hypothetical protein